jgi:hypothetical protein
MYETIGCLYSIGLNTNAKDLLQKVIKNHAEQE